MRFALFLALLTAVALLNAAGLVAAPDDGKGDKASSAARRVETSAPEKPALSSKKRLACKQTTTKKQVSRVVEKMKKFQDKNSLPKQKNP